MCVRVRVAVSVEKESEIERDWEIERGREKMGSVSARLPKDKDKRDLRAGVADCLVLCDGLVLCVLYTTDILLNGEYLKLHVGCTN